MSKYNLLHANALMEALEHAVVKTKLGESLTMEDVAWYEHLIEGIKKDRQNEQDAIKKAVCEFIPCGSPHAGSSNCPNFQ